MGQLNFKQEFLAMCAADVMGLLAKEHAETEKSPNIRPLNPNWPLYQAAEDANILKIFTARTEGGKLVGYITVFCNSDPHSTGAITCSTDLVYILPSYRRGLTFRKLLSFVENCLMEDGMKSLNVVSRVDQPLDKILSRAGYFQTYVIHEKVF